MNFDYFRGNEKIKQQLSVLAASGRLPHAIILEGEEGLGKRTLARELALNLYCKAEENRPCRQCPQCIKVLKNVHPDIFSYTAPDRTAAFSVKTVREIIEDVYISPNEAPYKIYILGNCQSMSASAQNAFLKILEEPPAYAVFVLCVTNKSMLLETVLSRSVVFTLEKVELSDGAEYISDSIEGVSYDEAYKTLELAGGNIGKAINTLDDGELAEYNEMAKKIALAVISDYEYSLLKECSSLLGSRDKAVAVLSVLKKVFRDALFYSNGDYISGLDETAQKLSNRLGKESLFKLINSCEDLISLAKKNCNNNILITKISCDFRRATGK